MLAVIAIEVIHFASSPPRLSQRLRLAVRGAPQKRFRARQRERARDSAAQMEALSAQMGRLMQEKAELETRNRILEQVVKLNVDHVEQLQSHKVWCTHPPAPCTDAHASEPCCCVTPSVAAAVARFLTGSCRGPCLCVA